MRAPQAITHIAARATFGEAELNADEVALRSGRRATFQATAG